MELRAQALFRRLHCVENGTPQRARAGPPHWTPARPDDTTIPEDGRFDSNAPVSAPAERWALVLCWSRTEPWRVGQVLFIEPDPNFTTWVGRGERTADGPEKGAFGEQRPGAWLPS